MPLSSQNSSSEIITGKILFFVLLMSCFWRCSLVIYRHCEHSSGHGTYELIVLYKVQYIRYPATGWAVRGTNPGGGEIFCTSPHRPWGPSSLLYNGYRAFPEVKRSGRGVDHLPPSSAEVKKRVELYLYSPFGPSWPVIGWTLPFPYIRYCFGVGTV